MDDPVETLTASIAVLIGQDPHQLPDDTLLTSTEALLKAVNQVEGVVTARLQAMHVRDRVHSLHEQRHGLSHVGGDGVGWRTVSNMPLAQLEEYASRKDWTVPIASSRSTDFSKDCGADPGFMLSLFMTDGTDVFRTYSTTARGVDRVLFVNNILDLAPYGRQEDWEDSPAGWPQLPTYD